MCSNGDLDVFTGVADSDLKATGLKLTLSTTAGFNRYCGMRSRWLKALGTSSAAS